MGKVKLSIAGLSFLVLGTTFYSCNKGKIVSTGDVSITDVVKSRFTSAVSFSTQNPLTFFTLKT